MILYDSCLNRRAGWNSLVKLANSIGPCRRRFRFGPRSAQRWRSRPARRHRTKVSGRPAGGRRSSGDLLRGEVRCRHSRGQRFSFLTINELISGIGDLKNIYQLQAVGRPHSEVVARQTIGIAEELFWSRKLLRGFSADYGASASEHQRTRVPESQPVLAGADCSLAWAAVEASFRLGGVRLKAAKCAGFPGIVPHNDTDRNAPTGRRLRRLDSGTPPVHRSLGPVPFTQASWNDGSTRRTPAGWLGAALAAS